MTRKDYIKISEALSTQMFFVADRATEIIRGIVEEESDTNGYILKEKLYGDTDDPDYIWVQDNSNRVVYLCKSGSQIFVGIQDDSCCEDETLEGRLDELNPLDRIQIADYLTRRFL